MTARSSRGTLTLLQGERGRRMHRIRADRPSPEMARKVLKHLDRAMDVTPPSKLAHELTGEARLERFHVLVPSDSEPGKWYEVRVRWHPPSKDAPHGYVEAAHYGRGCPASEAMPAGAEDAPMGGRDCWHLYLAVVKVATIYDPSQTGGMVPEAARPVRSAPPAERRAVSRRPRPTGTDPWGLG